MKLTGTGIRIALLVLAPTAISLAAPDFVRDIQPLLESRCTGCHGTDKQKSGYRLDTRAGALAGGDSGNTAITPGQPDRSPLLRHVSGEDKDMHMPPKKSGIPGLTRNEVDALRAWVAAGAPWPEGITLKAAAPKEPPSAAHWSHLPVKRPSVPGPAVHPVDAFLNQVLKARGLEPNGDAEPRTQARRLHLDLIGLPPTPEEVRAFEEDAKANSLGRAVEARVENLLASPRYGERWARHWLDVVRFAESHGFEMNRERPHAWPYRDYVIRAFNNDLPYDQFIREQLAGDQFGVDEATGFLVAGSWDQVKGQDPVLRANQRADELHDMVSTVGSAFLGVTLGCARCHDHKFDPVPQTDYFRIRAVFEGVQHGERPMRLGDDTGRQARLAALRSELATLDTRLATFEPLARAGTHRLLDDSAPPPTHAGDAGCIALEQPASGKPIDYSPGREPGQLDDPGDVQRLPNLGRSYRYWRGDAAGGPQNLFAWKPALRGRHRLWISWPAYPTHAKDASFVLDRDGDLKTPEDQVKLATVDQRRLASGIVVPANQKRWSGLKDVGVHRLEAASLVVLRSGQDDSPVAADALYFEPAEGNSPPSSQPHLRAPVSHTANTETFEPVTARFVRMEIQRTSGGQPCVDEFEVFTDEPAPRNVALASAHATVSAADVYLDGANSIHQIAHLNDGRYGNERSWIAKGTRSSFQVKLAANERIRQVVWSRDRSTAGPGRRVYEDRLPLEYQILVSEDGATWRQVASSQDRLDASYRDSVPRIPTLANMPQDQSLPVSQAVKRRSELEREIQQLTTLPQVYAGKFEEPPATRRLYRGDPLQPREEIAPGSLTQVGHRLDLPGDTPEAERRRALALWIADKRNPLTARVIVNRLWQQHFGRGLVDTPSDFGINGARPTHPELLDWLAAELMDHGWSLKHVQRLITTSAAFRRSSTIQPQAAALDADARLLWRFPARRVEAEVLRDSILAVSGVLRLDGGGPGFDLFEPNDKYVKVYTPRRDFGPETFRRMVYQNKPRMQLDDTFGAFDCPDAGQITPRRNRSITALQALNLLNSPFLLQQADLMAARLQKEAGADPARQIIRAFELTHTRAPEPDEQAGALALLKEHGLPALCRALLNSSEFVWMP